MTPKERRRRVIDVLNEDEELRQMMEEYEKIKEQYKERVDRFPEEERNLLWSYPGMGYLIHSRMLNVICDHMKFIDEDEQPPQP